MDIGDAPAAPVRVASRVALGGLDSHPTCQAESRRLRRQGARRLRAPSAALTKGGARGILVQQGPHPAAPRDAVVIVVFGPPDGLVGWVAAEAARPPRGLLDRVRHYSGR